MDVAPVLKEILMKHAKAMAIEMLEAAAIPALEQAVKNTPTPIDDLAVAALKEPLKKALMDLVGKL
jgi:hypothetical protein